MLSRGLWVVFEGADGVGKTTVMRRVAGILRDSYSDLKVIETTHPGSTPLGEHLRRLNKHPETIHPAIEIDALSAQLLMAIDHINFRSTVLEPALAGNALVLADRCNLISGIVYGNASGVSEAQADSIFQLSAGGRIDRLYVLTCSEQSRRQRLAERGGASDRFERLESVPEIYRRLVTGPVGRTVAVNRVVAIDDVRFIDSDSTLKVVIDRVIRDIRSLIAMNI